LKILVVDIGGTHIKLHSPGRTEPIKIESGPDLTPKKMMRAIRETIADWKYDVVSIGYPGPVAKGKPSGDPPHLARGWVGFDFRKAFGCPVQIMNDAGMQALGSYRGGRMLFLGLGTSLGTALIIDGVLLSMELGHLRYKDGRQFEDFVGAAARKHLSGKKWLRNVFEVVADLKQALQVEYVVLGGGNAKHVPTLPPDTYRGSNENARAGGLRLWQSYTKKRARAAAAS
jgi:hypothetical protein